MKNITVVTGTRAEYGLLKNTIKCIDEDCELNLQLIVTGTHLSSNYGYTVNEIESDGFKIDKRIPIIEDDKKSDIATEMSRLICECSKAYDELKTDIVLILGDRYEIFAVATAAMIKNIPIAHISGGEVTEGAIDEQIRHAITKMSHIHFPGAKQYADNIKNMGEEAWRIFNVGDPAIENIKNTKFLSKDEIEKRIGFVVDESTVLVTFHSVTLELGRTREYINNLIDALKKTKSKIIITYPNSDEGGKIIIEEILKFEKECTRVKVFTSLGSLLYLSVMKNCGVVVGNSSSGIIEAPFMKKPTVNIGNRQKGRLYAKSIINCGYTEEEIANALNKAFDREFIKNNSVSLYGDGNTSKEIVNILKNINIDEKLLKKKLVFEN